MPKKPSRSPFARLFGGLLYVGFLGIALAGGAFAGWIHRSPLLSDAILHPKDWLNANPSEAFGGKDSLTLLILGCDEDRYYRGTKLHGSNIIRKYARSDMMLVAKLDFKNNKITGVSIPRDTKCVLPGWGQHKINAYHSIAPKGKENEITQAAVEHLLPGVHIDRVVVLDFDAFQKMVDTVDGVDVDVPYAMNYDDDAGELHIHLKPGEQHLNGYQAMGYVRFRHNSEGDFNRQKRQKDFMLAFKQAAFKDFLRIPEVAEEGKQVLNGALTDEEIRAVAAFAKRVPSDSISMGMVPVLDGPGSYLHVDKPKLKPILEQYKLISANQDRASSLG